MKTSPVFEIELRHFGVWRVGVAVLVLLACASLAAWYALRVSDAAAAWLGAGAACLVAAASTLGRAPRTQRLRWDGQAWRLGRVDAVSRDGALTEVSVAVDLGAWMLLCTRPAGARRWHLDAWLPAQRRGHEAHWHALRCAVYSPRPVPGGPPEAEP
jgi:hypothetical protein